MKSKNVTIGILAHVDAGKTTLSEAILYRTGAIRKIGRVDHKDAFLDTDEIERSRGITVFSKEARFEIAGKSFVLLDTPGHSDFGSEAERTLQVLDYAVLVVSGADGVQAHTHTIWKLLAHYGVPAFVFVNKMDRPAAEPSEIVRMLKAELGGDFAELSLAAEGGQAAEDVAMASQELMDEYLETGSFSVENIATAIEGRKLFPVFFGSALKLEGVDEFIEGLGRFTRCKEYGDEFGARVYKIDRDKQGNRLTHLKVTGGTLRNKMVLDGGEKIEQIRIYNGEGFESAQSAGCGSVCAVLGPSHTFAGGGLGCEGGTAAAVLQPALSYEVLLPSGIDPVVALAKFRELEEEEPSLRVLWSEERKAISIQVMGELELEILKNIVSKRFEMDISFGNGGIIYKETIAKPAIGIGHYEPLRHYAEVQLLLEPLPAGSGLVFDSLVSEDKFARNWQRLVQTHLAERVHRGVLTGSEITDMRISIAAGRAHPKHTEGGDFRQATYRALRQGLRMAESILLEPVYAFRLKLPNGSLGRALTDLSRLGAEAKIEEITGTDEETFATVSGTGPVSTLREYAKDVAAYTKGRGIFSAVLAGYAPCKNQDEVVSAIGYDPEADIKNPTGSVFCEHGAAVYVNWDEVGSLAHLEPEPEALRAVSGEPALATAALAAGAALGSEIPALGSAAAPAPASAGRAESNALPAGAAELEAIFLRTYGKSKRDEAIRRANQASKTRHATNKPAYGRQACGPAYGRQASEAPAKSASAGTAPRPLLLVDGYNVIFAWEELADLSKKNFDSAREALIELVQNYAAYKNTDAKVVFDGYKLPGNAGTNNSYGKLGPEAPSFDVVYTKEAKTADRYIEETTYALGKKRNVTVVTSDRPVQMAALGDGATRMSARELIADIKQAQIDINAILAHQSAATRNRPFETLLDPVE